MRTEYFAQDVCGWKPSWQLDLVLMTDIRGSFPLYSSASCDLPNEQLGHQLRVAEQNSSGDFPWFPGTECPQAAEAVGISCSWCCGEQEGALEEGLGLSCSGVPQAPVSARVLLPALVSWALRQSRAMALLKDSWDDSAVSWSDKMSCSWSPFVSRLQRTGRLRVPFACRLGVVALHHRLSLVGGQEESAAQRSASEAGAGRCPTFQCNPF